MPPLSLSPLARRLIDHYQRGLPLTSRPYAEMAAVLDSDEDSVLGALEELRAAGILSRVGAVVAPHRAGFSTLAAMEVPEERLEAVAALVSLYDEVNHNYEREHRLNLWFVVTASGPEAVQAVLADIARRTGLTVLDLPLVKAFHIDLGFPVQWN